MYRRHLSGGIYAESKLMAHYLVAATRQGRGKPECFCGKKLTTGEKIIQYLDKDSGLLVFCSVGCMDRHLESR